MTEDDYVRSGLAWEVAEAVEAMFIEADKDASKAGSRNRGR